MCARDILEIVIKMNSRWIYKSIFYTVIIIHTNTTQMFKNENVLKIIIKFSAYDCISWPNIASHLVCIKFTIRWFNTVVVLLLTYIFKITSCVGVHGIKRVVYVWMAQNPALGIHNNRRMVYIFDKSCSPNNTAFW